MIDAVELCCEYNGLKPFKMSSLGSRVVLVGPNGAGKTRLMDLLAAETAIGVEPKHLKIHFRNDQPIHSRPSLMPHILELIFPDPKQHPPELYSGARGKLGECTPPILAENILLYLEHKCTNPDDDLYGLSELLNQFLGTSLTHDSYARGQLFGLPFKTMALSQGQTILLMLCGLLQLDKAKVSEVLFLDEPECHLHPRVLLAMLNLIEKKYPTNQVWLATHSLALVSMANTDEVWYCENGRLSKMGSNSEKVLSGLVGDDNNRARIYQMFALPAVFASNVFASECLREPSVLPPTTQHDPQSKQVLDLLEKLRRKKTVDLLDFGAGKGRFLGALQDRKDTKAWLEYFAYDENDKYADDCRQIINQVYGSKESDRRYFTNLSKCQNKFDVVMLVNVLHEIPPDKWEKVFLSIYRLLRKNGGLLIVENEELTHGEKAYASGFAVIQEKSLASLFPKPKNITNSWRLTVRDKRKPSLVAHFIVKDALNTITTESVRKCLNCIKKQSIEEIKTLRKIEELDFKASLKHAFWTQQLANSLLCLQDLQQCNESSRKGTNVK